MKQSSSHLKTPTANTSLRMIKRLFLLMIVLMTSSFQTLQAEERWYQIELIIFSTKATGSQYSGGEIWGSQLDQEYLDRYIVIDTPEQFNDPNSQTQDQLGTALHYKPLPTAAHRLTDVKNKLRYNGGYDVLYHHAWNQPISTRAAALPIKIDAGGQYGSYRELSGTVKISKSRYFHIDTNLFLSSFEQIDPYEMLFSENDDSEGGFNPVDWLNDQFSGNKDKNPEQNPIFDDTVAGEKTWVPREVVSLKQSRRMRSKELHYLDNPRLSVFVMITPYESDKKSTAQAVSG